MAFRHQLSLEQPLQHQSLTQTWPQPSEHHRFQGLAVVCGKRERRDSGHQTWMQMGDLLGMSFLPWFQL